ncbi:MULTISPECIES: ROK family protein [Fictibacillus]|uniref:Glucose kinase n=1 Tax=Fictibacillus enclensis TaxID=1017270 RepID=A0A0V8J3V1_9BACL|nr:MULTISPECIES: ROK family protein [Fictibacillus]KSU81719.1 glucose kinase [Fictibacillus enclensis]RXZ01146.1 ROK family protein [Fictibacillus sp. S7]SCC25168.1 glucokinase [Fictibacillus enclensis]
MNESVIGIDVGGTNIRVGLVENGLSLTRKETALTTEYKKPDEIFKSILDMIKKVDPDRTAKKIGIGLPVPWPDEAEKIVDATNIPWLEEVSVDTLRSYFPGYQVFIDNDVNMVALLEAHYGAAKGCRNAMYITVSTGVGSGIIIDNKILRGSHGYAGEIGSMIVSSQKKNHPSLYDGSLESLCSGLALEEESKRLYGEDATSALLFERYQKNDEEAKKVIDLWIEHFSNAIASLIQTIDPEIFVLGGAVIHHNPWLIEMVAEGTRKKVFKNLRDKINIVINQYSSDAGVIGAGFLAIHQSEGEI